MSKSAIKKRISDLWYGAMHVLHTRCAVCWSPFPEAHHIIPKGNAIAWSKENGIGLCKDHHTGSGTPSAHGSPEAFKQWLADKHPETARWVAANEHRIEPSVNWEAKLKEVEAWALPILEGR
jgi:hypothetical protein